MTDFFSEVPPAPVLCLHWAGASCWVWMGGLFSFTQGEQTGTGLMSLGHTWRVDKEDLGFQ